MKRWPRLTFLDDEKCFQGGGCQCQVPGDSAEGGQLGGQVGFPYMVGTMMLMLLLLLLLLLLMLMLMLMLMLTLRPRGRVVGQAGGW